MNKKFLKSFLVITCALLFFPFNIFAESISINQDGVYDTDLNINGESVTLRKYVTGSGQLAVCINPGKRGPNGASHSPATQLGDTSSCSSALYNQDGSFNRACGFLVIQQQAYEMQKNGSLSEEQAAMAVTIASRMWASKTVGEQFADGNFSYDIDEETSWDNPESSNYVKQAYSNTASAAMNAIWALGRGEIDNILDYSEFHDGSPVLRDSAGVTNVAVSLFANAFGNGKLTVTDFSTDSAFSENGSNVDISNNLGIGNLVGVTDMNGNTLPVSSGTCASGEGECVQVDLDSICKNTPGKKVSVKVKYVSDDVLTNVKLYRNDEDPNDQNFSVNAIPEYDNKAKEKILEYECPTNKECEEVDGICYGPDGEEIPCDKMEELCGPCIIEDGVCTRNGEPVDCAECDVCVKVGHNCFIAGNQVPCEGQSPECEDVCVKVGDDCTVGGEIVDCADYPECTEYTCKKENGLCYLYDDAGKKVSVVACDGTYPGCDEDEPDNPGNCPIKKIDELPYDTCKSGDTEGELADPPMCSILKNTIKGAYEIDEYGDSQYCDVFCRETYSFKFMDKETVQSGRYFRHDVEKKYVQETYLSTVVTATQQCTSLIDYDKWKKDYMAANSSVRNAFNTVKYWESLYDLNGGQPTQIIDCGGGASGCDGCHYEDACGDWQLIWQTGHYAATDAYAVPHQTTAAEAPAGKQARCPHIECVSYSDGRCTDTQCVGPWDGPAQTVQQYLGIDRDYVIKMHTAAVNAYKGALNNRNSLIYKIFNCNFFDDGEVSKYFNDPKTYFVSKFAGSHGVSPIVQSKTYHDVLRNYAPNSELIDLSYDDQARLKEEGSASNVWFDKEITPPIGTEGIEENKGYKTSAESNDPEDNTVCGGCDDPIHDSLSDTPKSATADPYDQYGQLSNKEYGFWVCYDSLTGAHCDWEADRLTVPYNYVANLEVTREIGYWQSTQFATEIFTGKVVEGSGGLQLPEKTWPVAIGTLTGDYNIFLKFSKFGDAKRKNETLKLEFDDDVNCAYTVVNEMAKYDCDDGYHECYDCDDPSTPINECYPNGEDPNPNKLDLGFYFRSIDLDDVFPNSTYSPNKTLLNPNRPIGSNWSTDNAIQVINKIQDLGEGYLGGGKEPEYTITLTPAMRKQVTKNNREIYKADYLTPSTLSCNHSTAICQSTWLQRDLRNILEDYNHGNYYVQNDNSRNNLYVVGRNR